MLHSVVQHMYDDVPIMCQASLEIKWKQNQTWLKLTVNSSVAELAQELG